MRSRPLALGALLLLLAGSAHAQAPKPSAWTGGVRGATVGLDDSSSLGAVSGVIEYRALGWLKLGVAPTFVHVTSGATTTSGLGDLPLALEASGGWSAPFHPELGASVIVMLPTGRAACGLGSGTTSVGMNLGAAIAPIDALHLSADATRSFSGAITLSALGQPQATWIDLNGDIDLGPRWTLSLSAGGDVGGADTLSADREVGGGVGYAVRGPLELRVDVTHGVAGAAPRWGVAVSLGTGSSALSPVNSISPVGHQHQVFFGGGIGRGRSGRSTGGGGGTTTTTSTSCP
jgi:hypothetical protein